MTALHDPTTATVLAHAVRRWEAEVENARRLSNRENGILGVIAMLLGLGLFRGGAVTGQEHVLGFWLARALLAASIVQIMIALGLVLWIPRGRNPSSRTSPPRPSFASGLLFWPGAPRHMKDVLVDDHEANLIAIRTTTAAVIELLKRNTRRKSLLDASQRFLFGAALTACLAMACYD